MRCRTAILSVCKFRNVIQRTLKEFQRNVNFVTHCSSFHCLHERSYFFVKERYLKYLQTRFFDTARSCYSDNSKYRYPRILARNLKTMKIDSPEFHGLFTPELTKLADIFAKHGHELRIAGGAVRDLFMGKQPHDLDFATTATPDEMIEMFELEKIRMINAKGVSHGTITARINDKENFEVTTLRIDIRTDGRHAEVQFTKDWGLDANRRDLTINSMFLGLDGTLYDYFTGQEDIEKRRVRFVGNAADRIQEDFLRILRYFRFYGRIARSCTEHEEETLIAIRDNADGLKGISGERIWLELKKIVVGNYAGSIMKTMVDVGMTQYLGLPEKPNLEEFQRVCDNSEGYAPEPMTRIAALLATEDEVYKLNERLKMSGDELKMGLFIVHQREADEGDNSFKFCQYLLTDNPGKEQKVKAMICELLKYKGNKEVLERFTAWKPPVFPVSGGALVALNVPNGPVFKKVLDEMRQLWKFSDYQLSKEELLKHTDELLERFRKK